ncbi:MAG: ABC transporter ATP-binding protein [Bdellovibrionia bacterium]
MSDLSAVESPSPAKSGVSLKSSSVRVEGVSKSFQSGHPVLKNVSLDFPAGKLTYILGTSGAGKSVLLRHILGLMLPDQGHIWVDSEDVTRMNVQQLTRLRMKFGMLFQNSALFDDLSVFENVAFPLREHTALSESEIEQKVGSTLAHLGMTTDWAKFPNELSGGMKKRVGLARAIIREPSILFYDEPTTGLDPVTRTTVDSLIETLKNELHLTSIVISHDIPSALLLADQIAFLHQGEFVFTGSAQQFKASSHPAIQSFLNAEKRTIQAFQN